jgi:hypothetical protein
MFLFPKYHQAYSKVAQDMYVGGYLIKVPPEIRCIEVLQKFNVKLKDHLMKRPIYSIEEYLQS